VAELMISNKGIALVQEVMYQARLREMAVSFDPCHNFTQEELDLFNEVASNITDFMVDAWETHCEIEGVRDLKSEKAKEIFHRIYENQN